MALTVPKPQWNQPAVDPKTGIWTRPWWFYLGGIVDSAGTGDAPADADYVLTAPNATLTNGRVLTSSATATVNTAVPGQVAIDVEPETVAVAVDPNGALDGDGTTGDPLAVRVDGVTVMINGSNQLSAVGSAITSYVPMSTGAEPLEIMSDGAGSVLLVGFTP